jgi:uncharacterized protein (DUF1800 family)
MQGETRVARQGATWLRDWRGTMFFMVALVASLMTGFAHGQRNSPPTVTLSASSTSINPGQSTLLTAVAKDVDGTIARVTFFQNGVQVAQVSSAPYTYAFATAVAGNYTFTAVAVDNTLAQTTSVPVVIGVGMNAAPTVSLSASPTSLSVGAFTTLTATAADADGSIASVKFYSNGGLIGTSTTAPYTLSYSPSTSGTLSLTAVATDNKGTTTTSAAVPLTVTASVGGRNSLPTVSLSASVTSFVVGGSTTLTATAADSDGSVTKVEFYNGAALLATDTTSPYTATFTPAAAGTYSITARAYDNSGGQSTSTAVSVAATAAPQLPRVTLALSNTLFTAGATVTLTGTAAVTAAGATVTRVSFYMNGAKLVDDTASPYTTTATLPSNGTYTFYAEVQDSLGQIVRTLNQKALVQTAPAVATTDPDIWRLLNQATFGASQAEAARVVSLGIPGWINDQLTKPISGYPDSKYNRIQLNSTTDCTTTMPNGTGYPADSPQAVCARDHLSLAMVQRDFFTNAIYGSDQLRQRVAWALSQIVVTSANEPDLSFAHVMSRFQNIMFQEAFGNYESLLRKVTYNPAMGNYLDMVNNDRPSGTRVPNENYAREIMQLFSINLVELNADGTPILDATGNPIPTYGQTEISEFARVFTGYTYANSLTQTVATGKQGRYYGAPMVPYPTTATAGHDPNAKTLLNGTVLPAGQSGQQDIDAAVRNVFMHPNTGVYVGKQLIQHLVTGNPSPAYVARVTAKFNDNGAGVRGDMAAVVKAILLDPEARGPAKTAADYGQLREPVLAVTGLLRGLNALTDGARLEGATSNLGQRPYYSPTVFNYFMPDAKVPGTSILGPEFGIHTTVTAVGRANLIYTLVYGGYAPDTTIPDSTGTRLFLAPFEAIADQPAAMVSLLNQQLAGGQFPVSLEPIIVTAVQAVPMSATPTAAERTNRARMAVYLMASSYDYQVQR